MWTWSAVSTRGGHDVCRSSQRFAEVPPRSSKPLSGPATISHVRAKCRCLQKVHICFDNSICRGNRAKGWCVQVQRAWLAARRIGHDGRFAEAQEKMLAVHMMEQWNIRIVTELAELCLPLKQYDEAVSRSPFASYALYGRHIWQGACVALPHTCTLFDVSSHAPWVHPHRISVSNSTKSSVCCRLFNQL